MTDPGCPYCNGTSAQRAYLDACMALWNRGHNVAPQTQEHEDLTSVTIHEAHARTYSGMNAARRW